ncbi:MAG: alpha-1,3-galactosidase B [Bacteroidetes bacterium]|nr:alpha-1,3-galactosidase B [Bacteroidota bacterium]
MKRQFTLLMIFVLPLFTRANNNDTVFIKQLGLLPGTRENAVKIVQQALEFCRTKENPVLVFEKGRYDFWPQYAVEKEYYESNTTTTNPKRCAVWIYNFDNLVIDANGSDFIYHDRIQPFTIDSSRNITVKNVNIDWDVPLTAQAIIKDTAKEYLDMLIDTIANPYIIEKDKIVFVGEGWKSNWWGTMEFQFDTRLIVPQTGDNGVLGEGWENYKAEKRGNGIIRLHYPFIRKPSPGNIIVMRHNERDHAGIFIISSKNVRLDKINIYQTAGLGVLSQYSENLSFSYLRVVPDKTKGRYYSGHDDGCHFSNCKGKIVVDHAEFEGLMDDPINVHGTAVQVVEIKSPSQLLCRFMHEQSVGMKWAGPGDSIAFINHDNMQSFAYGVISDFTPISREEFVVSFRNPVPSGLVVKDALENITWTPDLTVTNSLLSVNRARGILVSTPGKVVIENNTFESSGSAILIAGDANQWFESGAVKDVVIRKNNFTDACLTSMYQFCEGIISIDPEIPKLDNKKSFHRHISITENNFHPYDYPVLYAKSVDGLNFSNNTITRSNRFTPFHPRKFMFTFLACKNVIIGNNELQGEVLGRNILLQQTSPKELKLSPANIFVVKNEK